MRHWYQASSTIALVLLASCADGGTPGGTTTTPPPPPPAPPSASPVPLVLAVTPASRRASVQAGGTGPGDNAAIAMTGDGAASTIWHATHRQAWTAFVADSGAGSGVVHWTRAIGGMLAGTYVDTLTITASGAAGSPATIIDTLQITSAPVPTSMTVSPTSRSATVVSGVSGVAATAAVTLTGDSAAGTVWNATRKHAWNTLTTATGTGSGVVGWLRSAIGLAPATYVDTIAVTAAAMGSPGMIIDSMIVLPAPVPLALALSPTSHSVSVTQGSTPVAGSATLTISGDNAATKAWTAAAKQPWTGVVTTGGTGSGAVSWNRNAATLAAGTYVDTISVTATGANGSPARFVDTIIVTGASGGTGGSQRADLGLNADLHGRLLFPASNLWNQPVDTAQVDPSSAAILGLIGLTKSLHPDFGASLDGAPFGIPYIVVPDAQARYTLSFDYADESDPGPYPIPPNPPIEPGGGDDHLLVVTQDEWKLYELYDLSGAGSTWHAGSGAIWNLTTGAPRPQGWTSADAAGLPILPGLVRYDEVVQHGEIDHALRFTVVHSRDAWLAPASHAASSSTNVLYPPMGMRVRLKASVDISGYPAAAQVVLRALKKYGMIVADNGSDFFLSGTADSRWNDDANNTLKQIKVGDFEVVRMQGVVIP